MIKSPSTPYDVYRLQHPAARQSSGLAPRSPATPQSSQQSVFLDPTSPNTYASYRRNAGFGSPGVAAVRSPRVSQAVQHSPAPDGGGVRTNGTPYKGGRGARLIRRKPWKQRQVSLGAREAVCNVLIGVLVRIHDKNRLRELPFIWYDRIVFSEYLDLGNPAIGYPLGLLLHLVSLIVLAMHPSGALHFRGGSGRSARPSTLFAEQGSLALRRRQQQDAAWRWSANLLMLAVIVTVLANAYRLFTSRRRYHLWLKSTDEALQSDNARLVDLPDDVGAAQQKRWHDLAVEAAIGTARKILHASVWLAKRALYRLRLVRYVGVVVRFFFPPSTGRIGQRRSSGPIGPQMHALDVWQAPEVHLRIFALYSPLHLIVYLANVRTAPGSTTARAYGLVISFALMAAISAQTALLIYLYAGLVKDKSLIAGEVLNEYNQKVCCPHPLKQRNVDANAVVLRLQFVMPRAMPVCRDASTMTMQAEMIGPDDLRPRRYSEAETSTKPHTHPDTSPPKASTPRRSKKGRATGV